MPAWIWTMVGLVLFGAASFFFALAESALFSLGKWRAGQLRERSPERGGCVMRLLESPQDLLATIVLGNTFANAWLIGLVIWTALAQSWPLPWALLAIVLLFTVVLIAGELVPKTLAVRAPERWCLRVARPMALLVRISRPLRRVAQALDASVTRLLVSRSSPAPAGLSDGEYQELTEMAFQSGSIAASEKEMILQIIRLDKRAAKDVMKPRSQIASIPDDLSIEEMVAAARRHRHRRLPMYDGNLDTIVGVLNTRVLLLDPQVDLAEAIEFPSFVPASMNLLQLLKSLQRQQRGMAIVLDEYGGTAGLVTTEDILEEMIGQLRTEGEEQGFVMARLGENRWRVNGTTRIDDFRREYPALGEVPEVETMGGLVIRQLEMVPAPGESLVFRGLRLTVTAGDGRRIRELLVEPATRKGGR